MYFLYPTLLSILASVVGNSKIAISASKVTTQQLGCLKNKACQFCFLAQDVVYAMSWGKIKIPKCIMLPYTIKSLTNCTELIDICYKIGHGVRRSI